MPTTNNIITVNDFWRYEEMALGCSTDGRLPRGSLRLYKVGKTGKLTRITLSADMANIELTSDYIVTFGTFDEAHSMEDLSTLGASGLVSYVSKAADYIKRTAAPEAEPATIKEPAKEEAPKPVVVTTPDPEKSAIVAQAQDIVAEATSMSVSSAETFSKAGDLLKTIKRLIKDVGATFDPLIEQANRLHKDALAKKAKHVDPLKKAETFLKNEISVYAIAEQRRIEAEKRAAEEARLKVEAEQRRLADEALAAAQAERIANIDSALSAGDVAKASAIAAAPVLVEVPTSPVVPAFIKDEPPKMSGISTRVAYHAEVVDFMALIQAAYANPALSDCLQPNMSELNRIARASAGGKDGFCIPGVRFVEDQTVSVRA